MPQRLLADEPATDSSVADKAAIAWYYGIDDGYLGERHAAAWSSQTPEGWPDVVDLVHRGIATSDWSIPFGTRICLKIVDVPSWAAESYSQLKGRISCGIVVDRTADWVWGVYGEGYDLWPAMAESLMGKDYLTVGTVSVIKIYEHRPVMTERRRFLWGISR